MNGYQTERSSYEDEISNISTPISSHGDHAMEAAFEKDGSHGYGNTATPEEPVGHAPATPTSLNLVLTRPRWIPAMRRMDRSPI